MLAFLTGEGLDLLFLITDGDMDEKLFRFKELWSADSFALDDESSFFGLLAAAAMK
jgi:hypothetical protein